jgi:hypothetical protein
MIRRTSSNEFISFVVFNTANILLGLSIIIGTTIYKLKNEAIDAISDKINTESLKMENTTQSSSFPDLTGRCISLEKTRSGLKSSQSQPECSRSTDVLKTNLA